MVYNDRFSISISPEHQKAVCADCREEDESGGLQEGVGEVG